MDTIVFVDLEVDTNTHQILDMGACYAEDESREFHQCALPKLLEFLADSRFIGGHHFVHHDWRFLKQDLQDKGFDGSKLVDTLLLAPLLLPEQGCFALEKAYKVQEEGSNSPLMDVRETRQLFHQEVLAFGQLDERLQKIFYLLLGKQVGFQAFFDYLAFECQEDVVALIGEVFAGRICGQADVAKRVQESPIELAYALALVEANQRYSVLPRWLLLHYPAVEEVLLGLRNHFCGECGYCGQALDARAGLKRFFGYEAFRLYDGQPLQEQAVQAAIRHESLLAIFPTGGGKSLTFQIPALISGEANKGLTVVISPLQSLMKDQVDNLERQGITAAVTINGLLDVIERQQALERVVNGTAALLYISPELLRSRTIEYVLSNRTITRFVIDEAHCFSAWGQDFRVDYLYIAEFIQRLQHKKKLSRPIPVSCFTATAKPKVIEDICVYFKERLNLDLTVFASKVTRKNLHYRVMEQQNDEEKYQSLRELIEEKCCPTIVYVSRTKRVRELVAKLSQDGFDVLGFHGKMDRSEKSRHQEAFLRGEVPIMVATSAFGMGVDKKDVGAVIHYDISDSLENYIQEAGRAGRDEQVQADCFILFNDEDLSKHFILLNQTKLSIKEIQQIWKAIKELTKQRAEVSHSALEIARKAGWDDTVQEIETRVLTAIAALEDAGYVKRGQNMPRVFANSILCKTASEAIDMINGSERLLEKQKVQAIRIMKKLFSSKSRQYYSDEGAESRIDYIGDHLGMVKDEIIQIINVLRQEKVLADNKDLNAFVKRTERSNQSTLRTLEDFIKIETLLFQLTEEGENSYSLKKLNEAIEAEHCPRVTPQKIKTVLNFWAIKNWVKKQANTHRPNYVDMVYVQPKWQLKERLEKRHALARFIVNHLYQQYKQSAEGGEQERDEYLVEFSVYEIKQAYEADMWAEPIDFADVEDSLFYLSRIEAIKIEGGFLVLYNRLTLQRLELNNAKQYTKDDYKKLNQFYDSKVQQIHIVGEYARKMMDDEQVALQFAEDYFQMNHLGFIRKYFPAEQADFLKQKMTARKFQALFGELSPTQLKIIHDSQSPHIVVVAGPGSGKTRVLVHKLASLLLMEDVKHEQLLMLTFSRAAAHEFKTRLMQLVGNAAAYVEIKTFHSYCFDLLGKVGSLEQSDEILQRTVAKIQSGEVEANRITKAVLVIDEAQDMNEAQFALIQALIAANEELRVIAVGDDDQTIYSFINASPKYMQSLIDDYGAVKYELVDNYRSKRNLVALSNRFAHGISHRLKDKPIQAVQSVDGQIDYIRYHGVNPMGCLLQHLQQQLGAGSSCVLTQTNEEAIQIAGLLKQQGIAAKLIQSNEGFNLHQLLEVRIFLHFLNLNPQVSIISPDAWYRAVAQLRERFGHSRNVEWVLNLITAFEQVNPHHKYQSDLDTFIRESKLEDFYGVQHDVVAVSTIHKAKGREFDHVFLYLNGFQALDDDKKRTLYVALTRAKNRLSIISNRHVLDEEGGFEGIHVVDEYEPQGVIYRYPLTIYLGHRDVYLGHFRFCQSAIRALIAGQALAVDSVGCLNDFGQYVVKFSRQFGQRLQAYLQRGYRLQQAWVNFVVLWQGEEDEQEIRIVLPEIHLR